MQFKKMKKKIIKSMPSSISYLSSVYCVEKYTIEDIFGKLFYLPTTSNKRKIINNILL